MLVGPEESETAVCELPPALVLRIAELSPNELEQAADAWATRYQSDDYFRSAYSPDQEATRACLSRLADLAKQAISSGRAMFTVITP